MYTLKREHESFRLVSFLDEEVVLETSDKGVAETFLEATSIVSQLAPELESSLYLDGGDNCACDEFGDIWINPQFVLEIQEVTGMSLDLLLEIVVSHELGHAFLLEAEADSWNEVAAWLIGERLFLRLGKEADLEYFRGIQEALLPTYESDEHYKSWFIEAEEEASKGLSLLKAW